MILRIKIKVSRFFSNLAIQAPKGFVMLLNAQLARLGALIDESKFKEDNLRMEIR